MRRVAQWARDYTRLPGIPDEFIGADGQPRPVWTRFADALMPLHSAVANRNVAIARMLVEHGADVNAAQQDDFTPLMEAAQNGDLEGMSAPVKKGTKSISLSIAKVVTGQKDMVSPHGKSPM